jgi:hypothetical protein
MRRIFPSSAKPVGAALHRALGFFALVTMTLTALVVTGVIDEFYIFAYVGLNQFSMDMAGASIGRVVDSLRRGDWFNLSIGIKALKSHVLAPLLLVYFVRSLLYLIAAVLTILWLRPYAQRAVIALRVVETEQLVDFSSLNDEARRTRAVAMLRTRAARKRIESYAMLATALLSLVLAIGFLTRDYHDPQPEVLSPDATSPQDAIERAQTLMQDAQRDLSDNILSLSNNEAELTGLVREELIPRQQDTRGADTIKANQAVLAALIARPAVNKLVLPVGAHEVAKEYLSVAKAQLALVDRQAELTIWKELILAAVAKLAAVLLVLALVKVLLRLYQRGLNLSVYYDGIADAVQLGKVELSGELLELRTGLTPYVDPPDGAGMPQSVWDAIMQYFSKGKRGDQAPPHA